MPHLFFTSKISTGMMSSWQPCCYGLPNLLMPRPSSLQRPVPGSALHRVQTRRRHSLRNLGL